MDACAQLHENNDCVDRCDNSVVNLLSSACAATESVPIPSVGHALHDVTSRHAAGTKTCRGVSRELAYTKLATNDDSSNVLCVEEEGAVPSGLDTHTDPMAPVWYTADTVTTTTRHGKSRSAAEAYYESRHLTKPLSSCRGVSVTSHMLSSDVTVSQSTQHENTTTCDTIPVPFITIDELDISLLEKEERLSRIMTGAAIAPESDNTLTTAARLSMCDWQHTTALCGDNNTLIELPTTPGESQRRRYVHGEDVSCQECHETAMRLANAQPSHSTDAAVAHASEEDCVGTHALQSHLFPLKYRQISLESSSVLSVSVSEITNSDDTSASWTQMNSTAVALPSLRSTLTPGPIPDVPGMTVSTMQDANTKNSVGDDSSSHSVPHSTSRIDNTESRTPLQQATVPKKHFSTMDAPTIPRHVVQISLVNEGELAQGDRCVLNAMATTRRACDELPPRPQHSPANRRPLQRHKHSGGTSQLHSLHGKQYSHSGVPRMGDSIRSSREVHIAQRRSEGYTRHDDDRDCNTDDIRTCDSGYTTPRQGRMTGLDHFVRDCPEREFFASSDARAARWRERLLECGVRPEERDRNRVNVTVERQWQGDEAPPPRSATPGALGQTVHARDVGDDDAVRVPIPFDDAVERVRNDKARWSLLTISVQTMPNKLQQLTSRTPTRRSLFYRLLHSCRSEFPAMTMDRLDDAAVHAIQEDWAFVQAIKRIPFSLHNRTHQSILLTMADFLLGKEERLACDTLTNQSHEVCPTDEHTLAWVRSEGVNAGVSADACECDTKPRTRTAHADDQDEDGDRAEQCDGEKESNRQDSVLHKKNYNAFAKEASMSQGSCSTNSMGSCAAMTTHTFNLTTSRLLHSSENGDNFALWRRLGFQGSDLATDLRSTGLVGLLHVLYMMDHAPEMTQRLWHVCHGSGQKHGVHALHDQKTTKQQACGRYHGKIRAREYTPDAMLHGDNKTGDDNTARTSRDVALPFVLVCFTLSTIVMDILECDLISQNLIYACFVHNDEVASTNKRASVQEGTEPVTVLNLFPVLCISCELFIGCCNLFWQAWLQLVCRLDPREPDIRHFRKHRDALRRKVLKKSNVRRVFKAAYTAKSKSLLDKIASEIGCNLRS